MNLWRTSKLFGIDKSGGTKTERAPHQLPLESRFHWHKKKITFGSNWSEVVKNNWYKIFRNQRLLILNTIIHREMFLFAFLILDFVFVLYRNQLLKIDILLLEEETSVSYCDIFLPVCLLFLAAGIFKPLHLLPFTG